MSESTESAEVSAALSGAPRAASAVDAAAASSTAGAPPGSGAAATAAAADRVPDSVGALARTPRFNRTTLVAIVAIALIGWQWFDTRRELGQVREDIALRLKTAESDSHDASHAAREAQDTVRDLLSRLSLLDARVTEARGQQAALEQLYQELSRSRDESLLADIEQTLTLAAQQLQLVGNVQGALIALQGADARLARNNRPQFMSLRRAIGADIERLKAQPSLDLTGLSMRIDQIIAAVDGLPLVSDSRLPPTVAGEAAEPGGWTRVGALLWTEMARLVRVERSDRVLPPLLAPDQRYFLRENLKLRLLNVRVSLLQRNEATFRSDLRLASQWIETYFDGKQKPVGTAVASLRELQSVALVIAVPTLSESLTAVRSLKVAH